MHHRPPSVIKPCYAAVAECQWCYRGGHGCSWSGDLRVACDMLVEASLARQLTRKEVRRNVSVLP